MDKKKGIVPLILLLMTLFISACGSSTEPNEVDNSNKDKATDEKNSSSKAINKVDKNEQKGEREESHLDGTEKDTDNIIEKPEYNSFEGYVSSSTKDFNGESEMWDIYADEEDLKKHLVITSGKYLKHFNAIGEIPDELQELVNEGIELSNQIDLFDNKDREEVDKKYNQLKSIYKQLEKKIQEEG